MFLSSIKKLQSQRAGFTLLEMLISIFIFAMMAVAISGIYVAFTNIQVRARSYERLLNDSNYVVELMAKEFRNGAIFDYTPSDSCISLLGAISGINDDECMIFVRTDGSLEAFMVYNNNLYFITPSCKTRYADCPWDTDVQNYTVLLGVSLNGIKVPSNGLQFKISPTSDPFANDAALNNRQPMVTMRLQTEYPGVNALQDVLQSLQTTVSARIYKR